MGAARNVVIYMADGLRWDHHPESIRDRGLTCKTIASSLHTPSAIASMLTGQYLPTHNIRGFTDPLTADHRTILDCFPECGLSNTPGNFNTTIYGTLLGRFPERSLSELDEPFAWFMRDAGGHAPYNGFDDRLQTDETVRSYLEKHGGDVDRIRTDYAASIDASVRRFERFVLDPLAERDLLEQTLVVFASDHGQLLGEYGHVGESYPPAPEVVYVPVTFIHPDLPAGEEADSLLRHVDLPPVIETLVARDLSLGRTDGVDVLNATDPPQLGFSFYDRLFPSLVGEFNYSIESVWDRSGGHAFLTAPLWNNCKLTAGLVTRIPAGIHFRRARSLRGLKLLFQREQAWGTPGFTKAEAKELLSEFDQETEGTLDLSGDTRDHLEDLGYL